MKNLLLLLTLIFSCILTAQEIKVSGVVTDDANSSLPGATVMVKGTTKGTTTDLNGKYSITAKMGEFLQFSFVGLDTKTVKVSSSTINVSLVGGGETLQDVVILGSRSAARTVTESAVPIDVISMKEISSQGSQANLNQILNMVAPSFTSNTTTVADGTDHIDPAQLRGLGPDQVLVLVNGKRRHSSSLVNINGSPGRGSVGTDLNAIPSFAIDKIEVLRDGASAQYGSDAIAGVINVNVKKATNKLDINILGGSNFSKGANDHRGGNDGNNVQIDLNYGTSLGKEKSFINATGSFQLRGQTSRAKAATGNIFNAYNAVEQRAAQAGTNINALWGNINNTPNSAQILSTIKTFAQPTYISYFSPAQLLAIDNATTIGAMQTALNFDATAGELAYRKLDRNAFNMRVGQSSLQSAQFFLNAAYPINDNLEVYAFGGTSLRTGEAAGFYRRPNQSRTYTALYPNGFLPEIHSTINDVSAAAGLRGTIFKEWKFDLSNTFGKNTFDYSIENTSNATLRETSPTEFDAGGLGFSQNTTNFDISRKINKLNIAFGSEFRHENFQINEGVPDSYNLYDINKNVVVGGVTPTNQYVTDFFGSVRPPGSQVFPGFKPGNAVNEGRNSFALYTDLEYDVTEKWMLNGALRYENYTDFGGTTNFKLATRYKLTDNINLRGAVSTGFRAPSLHQIYFNSTATQFIGGVPYEITTFRNDSPAAKLLGIPQLKQEESQSASVGFTAKIPEANLTITTDAYFVKIDDRVVLTDTFLRPGGTPVAGSSAAQLNALFDSANANRATFFANAIDTESKGIDIVISHKAKFSDGLTLKTDLSGTLSNTKKVGNIHGSQILIDNGQINTYFSETSRVYLEEAVPRVKANLTNSMTVKKFDFFVRNVYFGQVTDPNIADANGDGRINAIVVNNKAVENEHPVWAAKIITDLSVGYKISTSTKIVIGANNIFDIYPTANLGPQTVTSRASGVDSSGNVVYSPTSATIDLSNANQFTYSRNTSQFGQNGRFLFARLSLSF